MDLDFEWLYQGDGKWTSYGQLAQAIRETNPDMFFSISLHTVAYWFPAAYMQYVDYFTFQNYGPAIDVNTYNSMVSACGKFRNQGFPDKKIILSAPFQGTPEPPGCLTAKSRETTSRATGTLPPIARKRTTRTMTRPSIPIPAST